MPTMTSVQQILADPTLVPHIEEAAFAYSMHRFTMASRVLIKSDLNGWVTRKVSKWLRPLGARLLAEGVEIPASQMYRKRLAEIDPDEWGDRYPVTNRRTDTDPEDVIAEAVRDLGYSLGRKREDLLFAAELGAVTDKKIAVSGAYTLDMAVNLQSEWEAQGWEGELFHVIHPYQELDVKKELISLTNNGIPEFRNQFIRQWSYGGFGGLNIASSSMVPRKVTKRLVMTGATAGDKFRLRFGLEDTADITVAATIALTADAIEAALEALPSAVTNSWAFTVTEDVSYTAGIDIVSPVYVSEENQLTLGFDADGDVLDEIGITVQEISALARAPFFERNAVIYDVRDRVTVYQEWKPAFRTLDIGGYEVYGVGAWDAERAGYIETDATSPLAVP